MKKHKINLATQYVIIVCVLLVLVNAALGMILMNQSGSAMKTQIRRNMLGVADTAAASLDGDMLGALTEADVDSPEFILIENTLTKIINAQKDSDIKYIYCVKKSGDHFVFTVDPDPVDPGEFGEEVVYTPSQDVAWEGASAVDDTAYADEWGSFYTAWSPVRDSNGKVVGLVGVDFAASWFDEQEASHAKSVIISSVVSLAIGAAMMILLTAQLRRRFRELNEELRGLANDLDTLSGEIGASPDAGRDTGADDGAGHDANSISAMSDKVHVMQRKMKDYMDYVHRQAFTDSMTGVGNTSAYLEYVKELNRQINSGTAAFAVAVFDMNGLKEANDNYGHECGNRLIKDTARTVCRAFEGCRVFRIGGDEFIAIVEHANEQQIEDRLSNLFRIIDHFNAEEKDYVMTLSVSGGSAVYRPGKDHAYKTVFKRADENMYRNKGEFYRLHGDRRRHYEDDDK